MFLFLFVNFNPFWADQNILWKKIRICWFRIGCWHLMNKILGIGFRQQLPDIDVIVSDRDITYLFWRIKNKSKLSDVLFRYYTDLSSFSNFFDTNWRGSELEHSSKQVSQHINFSCYFCSPTEGQIISEWHLNQKTK